MKKLLPVIIGLMLSGCGVHKADKEAFSIRALKNAKETTNEFVIKDSSELMCNDHLVQEIAEVHCVNCDTYRYSIPKMYEQLSDKHEIDNVFTYDIPNERNVLYSENIIGTINNSIKYNDEQLKLFSNIDKNKIIKLMAETSGISVAQVQYMLKQEDPDAINIVVNHFKNQAKFRIPEIKEETKTYKDFRDAGIDICKKELEPLEALKENYDSYMQVNFYDKCSDCK